MAKHQGACDAPINVFASCFDPLNRTFERPFAPVRLKSSSPLYSSLSSMGLLLS